MYDCYIETERVNTTCVFLNATFDYFDSHTKKVKCCIQNHRGIISFYEQMFIFAEMKCERDKMKNVEREREFID